MQALLIKVSPLGLCELTRVFKARIKPKSNRPGNLNGVAGFKKQMNYTYTNVGVKVQPRIHSILMVFPAQMLKYLRCVTVLGLWCLWFIMRRLLIKLGKGN